MNDVDMIREGYANFAGGDLDAIRAVMSPDIVWHVPGRGSMAGDYRGVDAVIGYFVELFTRSGGTVKAELKECSELSPGRVIALVHLSADLPGGRIDHDFVQIFQREGGLTTQVWGFAADQYAMDEADDQTPVGLVKRGYAAFAAGDLAELRQLFAADIVWHQAGRSIVAGDHRGPDAVLAMFGTLVEKSGGSFRVELIGCSEVAPGTVAALSRDTGTMPGGEVDTTSVHTFRVVDGHVAEVTAYSLDTYAFDASMGASITLPDARTAEQAQPVAT